MGVQLYETTDCEKIEVEEADYTTIINIPPVKLSQCKNLRLLKQPKSLDFSTIVNLILLDPDTESFWISALCEKRLTWTLNQIANMVTRIYKCAEKYEDKEKYNCDTRILSKFIVKTSSLDNYIIPKVT